MEKPQYRISLLSEEPNTLPKDGEIKWFGLTADGQRKLDQMYEHPESLNLFNISKLFREECVVIR